MLAVTTSSNARIADASIVTTVVVAVAALSTAVVITVGSPAAGHFVGDFLEEKPTQASDSRAVGVSGGTFAGAGAGAAIGAGIGALDFGVDAVPGAIIGGAIGGAAAFIASYWRRTTSVKSRTA